MPKTGCTVTIVSTAFWGVSNHDENVVVVAHKLASLGGKLSGADDS